MQRRHDRRQRGDERIAARAGQALEPEPGHRAAACAADRRAHRPSEQLGAQAEPEHGNAARDGSRQEVGFGVQRRLGVEIDGRLRAAEGDEPVDRVELGERVVARDVVLLQP